MKFSNSHVFDPVREGELCVKFIAASTGHIFLILAAIPEDRDTWYQLEMSNTGIAIYKVMILN